MGLGKTIITLTAINDLIYDHLEISKVLIIAPLRVAQATWTREIEKWEHLKHLRVSKILGTATERREGLYRDDADIYIINRENVTWLVNELSDSVGTAWKFDMVVIDELSSFKSFNSKRFKTLRKVITRSARVVGLTGTPAPNGLMDLWSQVYLLDGGDRLGKTITAYRDMFFSPGKRNGHIIFNYNLRDGAEDTIHNRLNDICISIKAEDWLDMPERVEIKQQVDLSDKEMKAYRQFEKDRYMEFLEGEVSALTAASLTQKLLQYSNGAMYKTDSKEYVEVHSAKLDRLEEIIQDSNGHPLLVFYNFKHDLKRIQEKFKNAYKLEKESDIDKWNRGEIPLMLVHPASAGHGLNLQQGGSIIVWYGLTWSLELYQQANARLYRQGQKDKVIIHHLITSGTVDEIVMKSLQNKEDIQDELLKNLKARIKI